MLFCKFDTWGRKWRLISFDHWGNEMQAYCDASVLPGGLPCSFANDRTLVMTAQAETEMYLTHCQPAHLLQSSTEFELKKKKTISLRSDLPLLFQ